MGCVLEEEALKLFAEACFDEHHNFNGYNALIIAMREKRPQMEAEIAMVVNK